MEANCKKEIIFKEKVVYVDKIIEIPVEKIVYKEKIVEVPYEKIIYKDRIIEIPIEIINYKVPEGSYYPIDKLYNDFLKEVECIICREVLGTEIRRPSLYENCGHTVCIACYEKSRIKCPICNTTANENSLPKKNYFLINLIENFTKKILENYKYLNITTSQRNINEEDKNKLISSKKEKTIDFDNKTKHKNNLEIFFKKKAEAESNYYCPSYYNNESEYEEAAENKDYLLNYYSENSLLEDCELNTYNCSEQNFDQENDNFNNNNIDHSSKNFEIFINLDKLNHNRSEDHIYGIGEEFNSIASMSSNNHNNENLIFEAENTISLYGHKSSVLCLAKLDEQLLASGSSDGNIKIWELNTFSCIKKIKAHKNNILSIIKINEETIASCSSDSNIKFWDWKCGKCVKSMCEATNWMISICKFDDLTFISGDSDGIVTLWNLETCNVIKNINAHPHFWVNSIIIINDLLFATCSGDTLIKIWSIHSYECIKILKGHESIVWGIVKYSEEVLASCSSDGYFKLWNLNNFTFTNLEGNMNFLKSIALIGENKILSCSWDGYIKLWNIETLKIEKILNENYCLVNSLVVLGNNIFATSDEDKEIKIWFDYINIGKKN